MNKTDASYNDPNPEADIRILFPVGIHVSLWLFGLCRTSNAASLGHRLLGATVFAAIGLYLCHDGAVGIVGGISRLTLLGLPGSVIAFVVLRNWRKVFFEPSPVFDNSTKNGPFLLPGRTTHSRMFPVKHSFAYSYLQIAVPIGWKGSAGSFVAVDLNARTQGWASWRHWFTVDAADYLYRSHSGADLKEKLTAYLTSQSIDPAKYDSAWLVTAPRFLGYSFNPVSFWYLYQGETLKSMILEVNNTFDERRMYLMEVEPASKESSPDSNKHRATFAKDFHVSPFSSRKGAYSLTATPPSFSTGLGIDSTITQISSKHHTKLVARIFSTAPPLDACTASASQRLRLIAGWFWVGFVTFPRIVKEAAKLYFRRGLHVWFRPEVMPGSVGRVETEHEAAIELCWRRYLAALAELPGTSIRYVASGHAEPRESIFTSSRPFTVAGNASAGTRDPLSFEVLTPTFYSELVLAPSVPAYLESNVAGAHERRTFSCSSLPDFLALCAAARSSFSQKEVPREPRSLSWLRGPDTSSAKPQHELDAFAHNDLPPEKLEAYLDARRALQRAERYAFGIPALFDLGMLVVRLALCSMIPVVLMLGVDWKLGNSLGLHTRADDVASMAYFAAICYASWATFGQKEASPVALVG